MKSHLKINPAKPPIGMSAEAMPSRQDQSSANVKAMAEMIVKPEVDAATTMNEDVQMRDLDIDTLMKRKTIEQIHRRQFEPAHKAFAVDRLQLRVALLTGISTLQLGGANAAINRF